MRIRKGLTNVNNTSLYYEVAGSGDTVVFIHGFSLDTRMWYDQFPVFAQYYQVIQYDMRGFGKSALPTTEPYSHTKDLRSLLSFLGVDRASIVGLSRGGRNAIQFTLDYGKFVNKLVIVDAMPNGYNVDRSKTSLSNKLLSYAQDQGVEKAKQVWLRNPIFAQVQKKPQVFQRVFHMVSDYSGWHWLHKDPILDDHVSAVERLSNIDTPTLVITGEFDTIDFRIAAEFIHRSVRKSQREIISNAGHLPNMEEPAIFNSITLRFLSSN